MQWVKVSNGQHVARIFCQRAGDEMSDPQMSGRAPIKMVEAYWEGLRNGRLMPNRGEVLARGLGAAMDNAFILERLINGFARLRVAGMRLNDLKGMETRSMPISAFFDKRDYVSLSESLEAVFAEPAIVHLTLHAPTTSEAPALHGAMVLMPLRSDLGDVTRALGCLVFDGMIGKPPRDFRIVAEERRTLTGFADTSAAPIAVPRRNAPPAVSGFAEDSAPFAPRSPTPPRRAGRPHLRLVVSDDDKTD